MISLKGLNLQFTIPTVKINTIESKINKYLNLVILIVACSLSIGAYLIFLGNGLGLAYNDARSHLDIARRVVEGLKPGLAQLGSVWLPLPHFLMIPFVVNDTLWHTGFAGAIISMISYVATVIFLVKILSLLKAGPLAKIVASLIFLLNLNILYLQSTAMTESLLIATMTGATYFLTKYVIDRKIFSFIACSFFIFLSTLVRYDGWFLLAMTTIIVGIVSSKIYGKKSTEGFVIFFLTLSSLGIVLWFLWNALIFRDPLYFAFGQYSARVQQAQVEAAGLLNTKGNIIVSLKTYWYAMVYNVGLMPLSLAAAGLFWAWKNFKNQAKILLALSTLLAPIIFNIIALFAGHSVLFVPEVAGDTWFNVRYGIVALPAVALLIGILVDKSKSLKLIAIGLLLLTGIFNWRTVDAVTIDDARVGSSQKNVSEVSGWLKEQAANEEGFVLISVASHDAIIFSSGMPMKKFIHEGTGTYWDNATKEPDRWARWIVMRTNDTKDFTFRLVKESGQIDKYDLVAQYPFADVYQLKDQYLNTLNTKPVFEGQK